ncbi:MAG: 50S ribosomal protein L24 [Candidatus Methanomethylicus sp.]|nr:50S ribosomal protein L24 [Candidatus Methanomethylicus sp.]
MTSTKPKVQRKALSQFEERVAALRSPLSKDLRAQYKVRTAHVRKGDTVIVTRGDYKGHEGKVSGINTSEMRITMEGVNMAKMDGTNKPVMIPPSKVKISKLDFSDKERKKVFESGAKFKEDGI